MKPKFNEKVKVKGFFNKIKALLNFEFEYEIIPVNGWDSDKGEAMKILMRSFRQINAEEENKRIKEMEKNTKKK